jgi:hypothetical protein
MIPDHYKLLVEYYRNRINASLVSIYDGNIYLMDYNNNGSSSCSHGMVSDMITKFKSITLLGQRYIYSNCSESVSKKGSYCTSEPTEELSISL